MARTVSHTILHNNYALAHNSTVAGWTVDTLWVNGLSIARAATFQSELVQDDLEVRATLAELTMEKCKKYDDDVDDVCKDQKTEDEKMWKMYNRMPADENGNCVSGFV